MADVREDTDQHLTSQAPPTVAAALSAFDDDALLDALRTSLGGLADDETVLDDLAALHLTLWTWRNSPFEDVQIGVLGPDGRHHGGLSNAEMMRANIEATKLVRSHVHADHVDWDAIEAGLVDRGRLVAGQPLSHRAAQTEVEELYAHIARTVADYRAVQDAVGWARLRLFLAFGGLGRDWWLAPWWADKVEVWLEELGDVPADFGTKDTIAQALVEDPTHLSDEVLTWALNHGLGFAGGVGRFRSRRANPDARFGGGLDAYQPFPLEWSYAARQIQRWTRPPGTARPPSQQVKVGTTAVACWVNQLDARGLARLLKELAPGTAVVFNGNPVPTENNYPTYLADGHVTGVGAGWAGAEMIDITFNDKFDARALAVFVAHPAQAPAAQELIEFVHENVADLQVDPDLAPRLWVWAARADGTVTHVHDASVAQLAALLAPPSPPPGEPVA